MMARRWTYASGALLTLALTGPADAKPIGPTLFCDTYPEAPVCLGGLPACTYCHTAPPDRNAYGQTVEAALLPGSPRPLSENQYRQNLPAALQAAEALDADGDGFNNEDEIIAGTRPYDGESFPSTSGCPPFRRNPHYDVCFYDRSYAFKKVNLDFCGHSPSFEDLELFRALGEAEQETALHARLDECLKSENWRGKEGVLWSLAHRKIRPLKAIRSGSYPGDPAGEIPLANYYDDYALFVYTQTDDNDARHVLTGDYFVVRQGGTNGEPTRYVRQTNIGFSQSVEQSRRAGLLTTKWYLVLNVMFTQLPRTAAAQAYRSFLGMDIAKLQGLQPVDDEPKDYDNKGVTNDTCAQCHSTLDPLTYPFAKYHGLTNFPFGTYDAGRVRSVPEAGVVLGQPVSNLIEWASVAANSDEFARATVMDYWTLTLGEEPRPEELTEFTALWRKFRGERNYRVEEMLHDLVRTEAYGVP